MSGSTASKVLRRLGLALCGVLFAAGFAEIALRLRSPHDAGASAAAVDDLVGRMTKAFGADAEQAQQGNNALAFHPLYAFDYAGADRVVDQRLTTFRQSSANEICVFVYGGSVSAQVGQQAPDEIERLLAADPRAAGKAVRVYPMGRGAYKAPQTLAALQHDLSCGFAPDVVLLVDGFNEVAVGMGNVSNGFHPVLPGASFWLPLVAAPVSSSNAVRDAEDAVRGEQALALRLDGLGDSLGAARSALASRTLLWAVSASYQRWVQAINVYSRRAAEAKNAWVSRGGSFDRTSQAALELCAQIWYENARSMRALCDVRGISFVHVLQPTLHDIGAKPATENELRVGGASDAWLEGVRIGYPLLRERGASLRAAGHPFFDATKLFEHERGEIYVDSCHFNEPGRRELSRFAARSILALERPFGARWSR